MSSWDLEESSSSTVGMVPFKKGRVADWPTPVVVNTSCLALNLLSHSTSGGKEGEGSGKKQP